MPRMGTVTVSVATSYPEARTASSSTGSETSPFEKVTMAFSVAKLTFVSSTPGTLLNARLTRFAHEAQVIPVTGKSTRFLTSALSVVSWSILPLES